MEEQMQIEEFKYVYNDYRHQLKQYPALPSLLKSLQKSTKKLECLNLYSNADRRQFDLQIEQKSIFEQISQVIKNLKIIQHELYQGNKASIQHQIQQFSEKMQKIKEKNIETFDLLNRQDQLLTQQIELASYYLQDEEKVDNTYNKIREQDEFDEQNIQNSDPNYGNNNQPLNDEPLTAYDHSQNRIEQLKKQTQIITKKISKINLGKGKWLSTDHKDFVKIYNRYQGNQKKVIDEGIKILGMKNIQIIDHLQLYEEYLQLEKQKKLVTQQYKQIKFMQQLEKNEQNDRVKKQKQQRAKKQHKKKQEQQLRKKQLIRQYHEKKQSEKNALMKEKEQKQEQNMKKIRVPLPATKKKQIIERNRKYIEDKQKVFREKSAHKETNLSRDQKNKMNSNINLSKNKINKQYMPPNAKKLQSSIGKK